MTLGAPYRKLWAAAAISNLGDGMALVAFPLLATRLTRDPVLIAGVAAVARLPWLLFALVAGALVDRLDRRALMGGVDIARAVLVGVLGTAVLFGWESLALLYLVVFALGFSETLFDNAAQAIMPRLVPLERLEQANARLYSVEIVANSFVGPPVGGALFAVLAAAPFLVDAGSFLAGAILVLTIGGSFRVAEAGAPRAGLRREIAEGLGWLWGNAIVREMAVSLGIFNLAGNAALALMVLYALEVLHLSEAGFGVLLAATAVGAILGTLLAARISRTLGRGPSLVAAALVSAAALGGIGALSDRWLVGALLAVEGFAGMVWNVITVSLRQSLIPDRLLGRVNSVYRLIGWGTIPVGALLGGVAARGLGIRAPFFLAAGLIAMMALGLVAPLSTKIRALSATPVEESAS